MFVIYSSHTKAYISKIHEDKKGNLRFSLYNENGTAAGIYVLSQNGNWQRIFAEDPKMFAGNSINNYFLDEQTGNLWLSQNKVGILKYNNGCRHKITNFTLFFTLFRIQTVSFGAIFGLTYFKDYEQ